MLIGRKALAKLDTLEHTYKYHAGNSGMVAQNAAQEFRRAKSAAWPLLILAAYKLHNAKDELREYVEYLKEAEEVIPQNEVWKRLEQILEDIG